MPNREQRAGDGDGVGSRPSSRVTPHAATGNPIDEPCDGLERAADDIDAEAAITRCAELVQALIGELGAARFLAGELDEDPDLCWRCDAAKGQGRLGLCSTCHTDLTTAGGS